MSRILVTGASGFLGTHTLPLLLEAGFEVHAVSKRGAVTLAGVHGHTADLLSADGRRELMSAVKPTHLLHYAWQVPPGAFWTSLDNITWLKASLDLLVCFAESGGRRWIGAGTCAEYDWSHGGRYQESDPCKPATLYGSAKHALHVVAEALGRQVGVEVAWGRIFYPYGPGEPIGRLLPSVIQALRNGQPMPCTEGLQVRDFIYAGDVARAFALLAASSFTGVVNVASGEPVSVRDIVSQAEHILGNAHLIQFGALPNRTFEPPLIAADVSRLQSLGFGPPCSLEEGVERTIRWWQRQ